MTPAEMMRLTRDLPTKSAKIRALAQAGVSRAEIARFLNIRYQHVRNVLTGPEPGTAVQGMAEPLAPRFAHQTSPVPHLTADGSVVLPPVLAGKLAAKPGDQLIAVEEDGGLWIGTRAAGVLRAQAIVRERVPEGVSLIDELLRMRRGEVEREDEKWSGR